MRIECHAECDVVLIDMLNIIMMIVVMLKVIKPSVVAPFWGSNKFLEFDIIKAIKAKFSLEFCFSSKMNHSLLRSSSGACSINFFTAAINLYLTLSVIFTLAYYLKAILEITWLEPLYEKG